MAGLELPTRKGHLKPSKAISSQPSLTQQSASLSAKPCSESPAVPAPIGQSQPRHQAQPKRTTNADKQTQAGQLKSGRAISGGLAHAAGAKAASRPGPARAGTKAGSKGPAGSQQYQNNAAGEAIHGKRHIQHIEDPPPTASAKAAAAGGSDLQAAAALVSAANAAGPLASPATSTSALTAGNAEPHGHAEHQGPTSAQCTGQATAAASAQGQQAGPPPHATLPPLQLPSSFRQALAGLR